MGPGIHSLGDVITRVIDRHGLDTLMTSLKEDGFTVLGPTVASNTIVYDEVSSTADLPQGWGDEQDGGSYRLVERNDDALFGYNLGQTSWKRFLFPPAVELLRIRSTNGSLEFAGTEHGRKRYAFFGARSCELAAIAIQDKVFLGPAAVDPTYATARDDLFVVAVNCGTAAATCFCTSMGTGPACTEGYDIVLTEVGTDPGFEYLAQSGSERGEVLLQTLEGRSADDSDIEAGRAVTRSAVAAMVRHMETDGIRGLLVDNPSHPRWEEVAKRCLTCGNCTLACPTCFCSTMTDSVTLDGEAVRTRKWDSCFSLDFTDLHGHPVRGSTKSRYRQWVTHKLGTWFDQFGTSGCVGCGRCITWCPVGIDITREVAAMREEVAV